MTSTERTDPELVSRQRLHDLQNLEFPSLLPIPNNEDEEDVISKLPRATLLQKIQVLNWHNASEKKNQLKTVKHFTELGQFTVTKSTLNRWVLSERKLRLEYDSLNVGNAKVYKTKPKFKYPEVNRCLEVFYDQSLNENKKYSERFLISKWTEFYKIYHQVDEETISNLTTKSNGWLHYFKKRSELKKNVTELFYKQRDEFKVTNLKLEKQRLQKILKNYSNRQIYQFDEIAIKTDFPFFDMNSALNEFDESDTLNTLSFINPVKRVTVGVLSNAAGCNIFAPLIVTDSKIPSRDKLAPNLYYNKNGLMTLEFFYNYLTKLDKLLSEPIVILCDNYYPHFVPTGKFQNISICYFSEALNHVRYYPMDYGILRLYKVLIKDCILQFFLKKLMMGLTHPQEFQFTKTDLIGFIMDSWFELIQDLHLFLQCFKNSGLLPERDAEEDVEGYDDSKRMFIVKDAARESQLIGLLKIFNDKNFIRINYTIDSFLFPKDEVVLNVHMTERDIVTLVKKEFEDNVNLFDEENNVNQSPAVLEQDLSFEDTLEIRELSSALLRKVKPFFDKNLNHESALQFSRFLNSFTKETNAPFLNSFMSDSNVKEKIERKRKRDESVSANGRFLEFEQGNGNNNFVQQTLSDSRIIHSYNFNEFSNDNVQKTQNSRYVMSYPNFNVPVNHSQYNNTQDGNNGKRANNIQSSANDLLVVQQFQQQLQQQQQQRRNQDFIG